MADPRPPAGPNRAPKQPFAFDLPLSEDPYSSTAGDKSNNRDVLFKAQARRLIASKIIDRQTRARETLDNATGVLPPSAAGIAAFKYISGFRRDKHTPVVNLLRILPGLHKIATGQRRGLPSHMLKMIDKLQLQKFNFIKGLRHVNAGVSLVQGVAGSGKTQLVLSIIACALNGVPGKISNCPCLYIAPTNQAVDDFSNRCLGFFTGRGLSMPKIIRLYGYDSDLAIFASKHANSCSADVPANDAQVLRFMEAQVDLTHRFVSHQRLRAISTGLYKGPKLVIHSTHGNVSADEATFQYYLDRQIEFPKTAQILDRLDKEGDLTDEEKADLRREVTTIYSRMLSEFKGILVTTPFIADDENTRAFSPSLVFVDDAGYQSLPTSLIPLANFSPHVWMFLGDFQISSTTSNGPDSLLSAAARANKTNLQLFNNYRQLDVLGIPSSVFYGSMMMATPEKPRDPAVLQPIYAAVSRLVPPRQMHILDDHRNRLVVEFPDAIVEITGASPINKTHIKWALRQVKDMLDADLRGPNSRADGKPIHILIISMYEGQAELYRSELQGMVDRYEITREEYERVNVRTPEAAQGTQRDAVIVDFVLTEEMGHCGEIHRMCLALTRSVLFEVVLINSGMMAQGRHAHMVDAFLVEAAQKNIMCRVDSCQRCMSPTHTTNKCPANPLPPPECPRPECKGSNRHLPIHCLGVECKNCHRMGHAIGRCPMPRYCQQCGQTDHPTYACNAGFSGNRVPKPNCTFCGQVGHWERSCRKRNHKLNANKGHANKELSTRNVATDTKTDAMDIKNTGKEERRDTVDHLGCVKPHSDREELTPPAAAD